MTFKTMKEKVNQIEDAEIDILIDDYKNLVESQHYQDYIKKNPAGTSWTEYRNDFRENVIEGFRYKKLKDILGLIMQSGAINSPTSFSDIETAELAMSWHVRRVSKNIAIKDYFPSIEESEFIDGNALISLSDGRKFSLDTFRYLAYVEKIESKLTSIKKCKVYAELGSGNGGFARIIKSLNPNIKCVLVDLPEVLFTSRALLLMSFPNANHILVKSAEELSEAFDSPDIDFIYLSHSLFDQLPTLSKKIDLLCNMRSLGEMPEHVTKTYKLIIDNLLIENVFLENRFLNAYSILHRYALNFRKNEISGSTWMGGSWNTVDFEIEPEWASSPYESDHPRYLSICLSSIISDNLEEEKSAESIMKAIKSQLWHSKYRQLRPWFLAFKPTKIDNETLKDLWELNRKNPSKESLGLMIDFISYNFGHLNVEEKDFYIKERKRNFGGSHTPITKFSFKHFTKRVFYAIFNQLKVRLSKTFNTQVTKKYE